MTRLAVLTGGFNQAVRKQQPIPSEGSRPDLGKSSLLIPGSIAGNYISLIRIETGYYLWASFRHCCARSNAASSVGSGWRAGPGCSFRRRTSIAVP